MLLAIASPGMLIPLLVFLIPVFVVLTGFYFLAKVIADRSENREISRESVFWISFLLGPIIGLIVVEVSPLKKETHPTKACPECAEEVNVQAKLCKHCGYRWTA